MQLSTRSPDFDDLSWDQFLNMMSSLDQGVVVADETGLICTASLLALKMFGRSGHEIVGGHLSDLGCLSDESSCLVARRPDGSLADLEFSRISVTRRNKIYQMVLLRDVSQLRRTQLALVQMESRFRDLAESTMEWFWETDADQRIIFHSERLAEFLGLEPMAAIGLTFAQVGLHCNDEYAILFQTELAEHRPFKDTLFHIEAADGSGLRTLRASGRPLLDQHGQFIGYRGTCIDITREIAAEDRAVHVQQVLQDSIASLIDGVVVFDPTGRLVTCNPAYIKNFGFGDVSKVVGLTLEQILRRFRCFFDFEGRDFEDWLKDRLATHNQASGQPFIVRLYDGSWILSRECRLRSGGIVGIRTDITDIKRSESELSSLKTRYQLILDSAGEGIIGLDTDGLISFANQTAHDLLRCVPGTLIGQSFIHEIVLEQSGQSSILNVCTQGVAQHVTNQSFRRKDGTVMPVDYYAAPLMQRAAVDGAVLVFQDATLRVQYEKGMASIQQDLERLVAERTQQLSREVVIRSRTESALRESRARMKGVTDCLLEGVLVVNGGGDIMFANPAARSLLCRNGDDEMEGLPMDYFLVLGQNPPCHFAEAPWPQVVKSGIPVRQDDAIFTTTDGRQLFVAYACSPLVVEGGTVAAVILFRDIKELKDAQWDSMQASRLASVGQLAAGIAHEINTPTQYIGDNLHFVSESFASIRQVLDTAMALVDQVLADGDHAQAQSVKTLYADKDLPYLMEEIPEALEQSLEGVEQVRHIVLSMKEFSHPGTTHKVVANINQAIESTLTVCRNTWKHVATVQTNFDPNLPQTLCYPNELNQVFLNLIINATHAIESAAKPGLGVITITTRVNGEWIEILVQDTGTGIPVSIRDRIFDPFFTTKSVGKGTGQGLAICRDVIVTKHGGRLDFETVEGMGTTFTIHVPIRTMDVPSLKDEA